MLKPRLLAVSHLLESRWEERETGRDVRAAMPRAHRHSHVTPTVKLTRYFLCVHRPKIFDENETDRSLAKTKMQ